MSRWRWLVAAVCVAGVIALVADRGDAQSTNPFAFPIPPPGTPVGYVPIANDAGMAPWGPVVGVADGGIVTMSGDNVGPSNANVNNAISGPAPVNVLNNALTFGSSNYAATGALRFGNNYTIIAARNNANNADITVLATDVSNDVKVDAIGALDLGIANATSIAEGHSGITTTVTGGLTQQTGVWSLTGNGASQATTTSGNTTIDSAATVNIGTSTATSIVAGNSANTTSVTADFAPGTGATYGFFVKRNGSFYGSIQGLVGSESADSALYLGPGLTPSATNYTVISDGSTFAVLNAPATGYLSVGGSAYIDWNTSAVFPNSVGLEGLGLSTNGFGSSFLGASATAGLGYTEIPAATGAHNTQDAIYVAAQTASGRFNASYSAVNFNTYTLTGHHGFTYQCQATGRVVTPASGSGCTNTFWTTGTHGTADSTFSCTARATGWYDGSAWHVYANFYYVVCDVTTSANPASGSVASPVFTFNSTTSGGTATVTWAPFNDTCSVPPVIDVVSTCAWQDD